MNDFLAKLRNKENLTADEIQEAMKVIVSGTAVHEHIVEFLQLLRAKGPTVEEITGAAQLLQKYYLPVKTKHRDTLDTCGTGGDKKHTFNISTIAALVVAGAGVIVAKHGNRSVSSNCGSVDVLEAMGINLDLDEKRLGECLDKIGIAFLFAQKLHPAMKNVAAARKQLAVETIFNILGPLINPARATHQIMGVYSRDLVVPIAHVLKNLGLKRALVVHGSDGLDEVTTTAKTFVAEWNGREIVSYDIDPQELGIRQAREEDLKGGSLADNVAIVHSILNGEKGPKRDIVVLNAAYGLYAADKVKNISDGIRLAGASLDSGKAREKLSSLVSFTRKDVVLGKKGFGAWWRRTF